MRVPPRASPPEAGVDDAAAPAVPVNVSGPMPAARGVAPAPAPMFPAPAPSGEPWGCRTEQERGQQQDRRDESRPHHPSPFGTRRRLTAGASAGPGFPAPIAAGVPPRSPRVPEGCPAAEAVQAHRSGGSPATRTSQEYRPPAVLWTAQGSRRRTFRTEEAGTSTPGSPDSCLQKAL